MSGTRRTPINRLPHLSISRKALELFKLGCRMEEDGLSLDDRELQDVSLALQRELGLKPWHEFIFLIDVDSEPPPSLDPLQKVRFKHVIALRRALVEKTS
jgi:hypothetical protein